MGALRSWSTYTVTLLVAGAWVCATPSDVSGRIPESTLLLDALASAVKAREDHTIVTIKARDMRASPPAVYTLSDESVTCQGASWSLSASSGEAPSDQLTLSLHAVDKKGRATLKGASDEARLFAMLRAALCDPRPVKTLNQLGGSTLDPSVRVLLVKERGLEGAFFYRLGDPAAGSGLELDFELDRVQRLVFRRGRTAREVKGEGGDMRLVEEWDIEDEVRWVSTTRGEEGRLRRRYDLFQHGKRAWSVTLE